MLPSLQNKAVQVLNAFCAVFEVKPAPALHTFGEMSLIHFNNDKGNDCFKIVKPNGSSVELYFDNVGCQYNFIREDGVEFHGDGVSM